ncbi:MAG: hypothetical protein AVDCRST_MAG49-2981 [uncultured Thermomicrobiales bacterium]|uniref:Uncharacterized protein n=1 Tax=uncultured Thermomicrobiales bacterium TaxID=1645740 RepID=A0A6J4UQ08_9BACT|nr:MAG: hypothetical protein AVDCRST_MAG49-2981 [uncultured Thermomicrobiales bacterium]
MTGRGVRTRPGDLRRVVVRGVGSVAMERRTARIMGHPEAREDRANACA